jgi:hypothetical protein
MAGSMATSGAFTTIGAGGVSISTPFDIGTSQSNMPKAGSNFTYNQGNPLAIEVFINPTAAAYGISAAVINNTANGNSNTYSTIQSYAGGA